MKTRIVNRRVTLFLMLLLASCHAPIIFSVRIDGVFCDGPFIDELTVREMSQMMPDFHKAAKNGNLEQVIAFIEHGKEANEENSFGNTPLHFAGMSPMALRVAQILLNAGGNPNTKNQKSRTPLHCAVSNNNLELVKLLMSYGADPTIQDVYGRTPYSNAEGETKEYFDSLGG
jgi:ankyrin repeat protein